MLKRAAMRDIVRERAAELAAVHVEFTLSYVILVVGANHVSQFSEKVALSINSMH